VRKIYSRVEEHNVKLKDKSRLTGEQTVEFSKIRCGLGAQNPNGSKSQTDHGFSLLTVRACVENVQGGFEFRVGTGLTRSKQSTHHQTSLV